MNDDAEGATNTMLDAFGLTANELGDIENATFEFFRRDSIRKALDELLTANPNIEDRICQSLMSQAFSGGYSARLCTFLIRSRSRRGCCLRCG